MRMKESEVSSKVSQRFDLAEIIQHPDMERWGMKCLKPEIIQRLTKAEVDLNTLLQIETTVEQGRQSHKKARHFVAALAKAGFLEKDNPNLLRNAQENQALSRITWEREWHERLSNPVIWSRWKNKGEEKEEKRDRKRDDAIAAEVKFLQGMWKYPELHRKPHCLLQDIFLKANQTLPILYKARREIERSRKLPDNVRAELEQQFGQMIEHFENIKKQALASAYFRLRIAYGVPGSQLTGDIVAYTVNRLQKLGIIPLTESVFKPQKPLLRDHFQQFKANIELHSAPKLGEKIAKKFARKITDDKPVSDAIKFYGGEHLVIPRGLESYMPTWGGWPTFLFGGRHARIKFFKEQQYAFARFKQPLPPLPTETLDKDINEAIKQFLDQLDEHEQFALTESVQTTQKPIGYFQSKYRALLNTWQNTLGTRRRNCLFKRLTALDHLVGLPLPKNPTELQNRIHLIRRMETQLDQQFTSTPPDEATAKRYQKIKDRYSKFKREPRARASELLEQMADAEKLNLTDLTMLAEMLETWHIGGSISTFSDTYTKGAATEEALLFLNKQLMCPIESNFKIWLAYGKIVRYLSTGKSTQLELDTWLESLIINQMAQWDDMPPKNAQNAMALLEGLIVNLGSPTLQKPLSSPRDTKEEKKPYRQIYSQMVEKFAGPHIDQYVEEEFSRFKEDLQKHVSRITSLSQQDLDALHALMIERNVDTISDLSKHGITPALLGLKAWEATAKGRQHPEVRALLELQVKVQNMIGRLKETDCVTTKQDILNKLNRLVTQALPAKTFFAKPFLPKATAIELPVFDDTMIAKFEKAALAASPLPATATLAV